MRLLIWFWSGGGGGSQFAVKLANRLAKRFGAGAISVSLRADDPVSIQSLNADARVLRARVVSDRRRPLTTLLRLVQSAETLREHAKGVDAILVPMNFAAAAPLSFATEHKLVYFAHDPAPHPGDYEPFYQRITQSALMRRACRIVALSDHGAQEIGRHRALRSKVVCAPLSAVFEPDSEVKPVRSGPVRFLFLGRMIAYKGLGILADSIRLIAERSDWRLTLAGHGPALDDAMSARFNLPQVDDVRRGFLSEAQIAELLRRHDVLIAPYTSATQSGVVSDALACGMPAIVTPVGALAEQVADGAAGWITSEVSSAAVARSMREVIDAPETIAVKSRGARALAEAHWTREYWDWLRQL